MTIWKFPLKHQAKEGVLMPGGAKVLRVGAQDNKIFLWAALDPLAPPEVRNFKIYGTGHEIGENEAYVGSVTQVPYEWHIFEARNAKNH